MILIKTFAKSVSKRPVKSKKMKVISVCSVCGEPVCATTKDKDYRHVFNRFKNKTTIGKYSQEDGKSCPGSGQEVTYKRSSKK